MLQYWWLNVKNCWPRSNNLFLLPGQYGQFYEMTCNFLLQFWNIFRSSPHLNYMTIRYWIIQMSKSCWKYVKSLLFWQNYFALVIEFQKAFFELSSFVIYISRRQKVDRFLYIWPWAGIKSTLLIRRQSWQSFLSDGQPTVKRLWLR